jgi:ABC-type multidrug transport system fused ATPase/permease subunit
MDVPLYRQIRYLGKYLRPHKAILIVSLTLSIVSTALGLIQPYFAKLFIDRIFIPRDSNLLIPLLTALVVVLIVSFFIRVANNYIYTLYSAKLLFKMREDLFAHLQKVPLSFFSKKKGGDIFSRIATDMADIQELVTDILPHYLFDFLTCGITAAILLWLNWKMALLSFCILPAAFFMIYRLRPRLMELSRAIAETNADVAHFLFEALGGAALIRAFGAEDSELKKLEQKHSGVLKYLLRFQILGAYSGSVPTGFIVVNTLVVFGYGGYLVLNDALSIGGLVAFSIYQGRVFAPLQGMMDGFLAMQKSKVALARVKEIFDIEPVSARGGKRTLPAGQLRGEIVFENVSFAYEDDESILADQSFRIPAGEVSALIGPSGIGKTTVCHLLLRLFDPDAGRITLDGIDLREFSMDWLRRQMSLVSQDTFLFHTSIFESIRYAKPDATSQEIVDAAKAACIQDFIESLPDGYDTVIGDRGVRLSGGQKQRICIARSILLDPKILILDEATAFVDPAVEERLKETMRSLMKNRTIVIVSHRESAIEGAHNIIALHDNAATEEQYDNE